MLEPVLQQVVEQLCNEGCQQVNAYIQEIESGQLPDNMQPLNNGDREKVLSELKSIMAVYERCDIKK